MNRISPSWALMILALVFSLHLGCSTTAPPKIPQAPTGMVLIPGGTFMMGCTVGDTECRDEEKPSHQVIINSFYLDQTPVTVGAYREFVKEGFWGTVPFAGDSCNWSQLNREDHPVNCVNWNQAKAFCTWAGKRLPLEDEWEYAVRGGHADWKYPWGNEETDCVKTAMHDAGVDCGVDGTIPVKSSGATPYGLYDIMGNVSEWVEDCLYYYDGAQVRIPDWIEEGSPEAEDFRSGNYCAKNARGHGWGDDNSWYYRVSERSSWMARESWTAYMGFRCAKSIE